MPKDEAARGIHDHETRKLGRRPPKNAVALQLGDVLTGAVPAHPVAADHVQGKTFGLYGNDKFGDCGPTGVANLVRLVSAALLGNEVQPSQDDVFDLYRRSGNPGFNPQTDADDNGVDMQTMLEAFHSGGIGDGKGGSVKPIAFAKVDVTSDAELDAAVSIFGGVLWGVTLQKAQQTQTDASPPIWDYKRTTIWGGHCVLDGAYDETSQEAAVVSWDEIIQTTAPFRRHQLEEAWVVIFQWHLDHPAFQEGVNLEALGAAYTELTGSALPVDPTPAPGSSPADVADLALWQAVGGWATNPHHYGAAGLSASALRTWAAKKGLTGS